MQDGRSANEFRETDDDISATSQLDATAREAVATSDYGGRQLPVSRVARVCIRPLDQFGDSDIEEMRTDAVIVAVQDQVAAGLDVITDGEQTRYDFNLSFYGRLEGIRGNETSLRRFGPPAHDQRGKYDITGTISSHYGLGAVEEFKFLQRIAPPGPVLKASVPGPYTLSGRINPGAAMGAAGRSQKHWFPLFAQNLNSWSKVVAEEITLDEPSMSCYGHREDPRRFVQIFADTVKPVVGRCRLSTHLCFGNYKGRAVGLS